MLLALAASPTAFGESCGMGNTCPEIDSVVLNPGIFAPGQTGQVNAAAHDPDGSITKYEFSATAGQFPSGTTTDEILTSATSVGINWTAPATPGTYSITVTVWDNGGFMGIPTSGTVSTQTVPVEVSVSNQAPVIGSFTADPISVFLSNTSNLTAVAADPDGDPITFSWTTNFGTVTPGAPGQAVFLAPAVPGMATITVTVTDDSGAASAANLTLNVTDAVPADTFTAGLRAPQRVAVDSFGNLIVADRKAGGVVIINGSTGNVVKTLFVSNVTSVAVDWMDRVVVGTRQGARILNRDGSLVAALDPGMSLTRVVDVAVDDVSFRYLVLYGGADRVMVFDGAGTIVNAFGQVGDAPGETKGAVAMAVNPITGRVYLADAGHGQVHEYDAAGAHQQSYGDRGELPGEFNLLAGIGVDRDNAYLYAIDPFQSRLTVFKPDTSVHQIIGEYGSGPGQLMTPSGVVVMNSWEKLAVTSLNGSSVQVFDMQGAVDPPANSPPTIPAPIRPLVGEVFPKGTPIALETANATDPDFQTLQYAFELYEVKGGGPVLLNSWTVPEGAGTTTVDASAETAQSGAYSWRVRAFDGIAYSGWSADQTFEIQNGPVNEAPGAPTLLSPVGGVEVATLTPDLSVANAVDPDGDALTYQFEVYRRSSDLWVPVYVSPAVTEQAGSTSWTLPALLELSQDVRWRARASDGFLFSPWTGFEDFVTPPFDIPEDGELGNLPAGDRSRPNGVRYRMGPAAGDTPVYFQAWDIASGTDLTLDVNGSFSQSVPAQGYESWSRTLSVTIPAAALDPGGENRLTFQHGSLSDPWGIRTVRLIAPPIPSLTATPYNTVIDVAWAVGPSLPAGTYLRLYRSFSPAGPFVLMGDYNLDDGPVRDVGLTNDLPYYYLATYVDVDDVEGEASAVVSATPSGSYGVTPITDLRVHREGNDLVLTWTPVTSQPVIQHYEVYTGPFGDWAPDILGATNLWTLVGPLDGVVTVPGGAVTPSNDWYSVIPVDYENQRGMP